MTTLRFSDPSILARWCRAAVVAAVLGSSLWAQSAGDAGLRALGAGVEALEKGDIPTALRNLTTAQRSTPGLADYTAFWIASAHAQARDHEAVNRALEPLWKMAPTSPLIGRAALLGARSFLERDNPKAAVALLEKYDSELPQPQGRATLAQALEDGGDPVAASVAWQAVYCGWPLSPEAAEAGKALVRLESQLDERFPPMMPHARLERAGRLLDAHEAARARAEYVALSSALGGAERELARVRIGAADYSARRTQFAVDYLESLKVESEDADAERLYWLVCAFVRLDRTSEAQRLLEELESRYANSLWRQRALLAVATRFLIDNDVEHFLPLYQACADAAPGSNDSRVCHWKVTWRSVLERKTNAAGLLREHLLAYPGSDKAGACLYWLGRLAEERRDLAAARRFFEEVSSRFPNYYYTLFARERLARGEVADAGVSPETDSLLATIQYPSRPPSMGLFSTTAISRLRVERARLLEAARLPTWAEGELRWAARHEGPEYPLAVELGETATRAGAPDRGLRYMKSHASGYLYLPRASAPQRFWKLTFPWPYRGQIEYWCKQRAVDPYVLAGLIRQESEFNPKALSPSKAMGLTQVMPGTGRELSRRAGVAGFRVSMLYQAEPNIRLGVYFMRTLFERFDGNMEAVLAAYNAGPSRSSRWLTWGPFREPAEFVETIPFDQTRDYVQIVLRNAAIYRELYAGTPETPWQPPAPPKPPAKKKGKARS